MTIHNTNLKSREAFLSAFLCHVKDESQKKSAVKQAWGDSFLHFVLSPQPEAFFGALTEKGIRILKLRHFRVFDAQRVFTGSVEEDENGVVIKGSFRFPLRDKVLCPVMFFLFSLILDRQLHPSLFFALFGSVGYFLICWLTSLSQERDVRVLLSELS